MRWTQWLVVAAGAWLIVTPYVPATANLSATAWHNVVLGIIVGGLTLLDSKTS